MTALLAVVASDIRHTLAEGPVWDPFRQEVLWVDTVKGQVFEGRLNGDRVERTSTHDIRETVGAAVRSTNGQLLVAAAERLVIVAPSGERSFGPRIVPAGTASRTNDGACDPAGRFLIGTLALDGRVNEERLVRVEDNGSLTVIDSDLSLSNGLAWSPDGSLFYSTDTLLGVVWVRDYDVSSGAFGERREHLRIADGYPDGICVDSNGCLWIAIWGAGEVRSFSPEGEHEQTVHVPAPHPSSVAFVGPDLDLLLITTASRDLTEPELESYPDAGRLFSVRVGVSGSPCSLWSGSWLPATPSY